MSTYTLVKDDNGNIKAKFVEYVSTAECDFCGRVVPIHYLEKVYVNRDGHHDGRDGDYYGCRDVYGLAGTGMKHRKCRKY